MSDGGGEPDGAAPIAGGGGAGGDELPEGLIASGLQVHEVLGSGLTNGGGVLDGIGYFFTEQEEGGLTLTRTDGTVDGTQSVTSVAESFSADPAIVFSMPDRMYWMGLTVDDGKRWFSSDGTAAGTQVIAGFPSIDPGGTDRGARLGDSVVFATADAGGLRGVSTLDLTMGTATEISASQFSVRSTGGTFALLVDGSDVYLTDGVDPPMIAMSFPNGSLGGAIQLGTEMLFWWNFGGGQMEMWKTSYAAEAAEKVMDVQAFQRPVVYQDKV
ncbi:MAG TPA: hypothetical protein VHO25_18000, partial [Polyangiaceae bacterium]|nr:hypothetical protein [Polyangiaceae bacterium]